MADILKELKESARRRRGSNSTTRAQEARKEEEGCGQQSDISTVNVAPSPRVQLLKRVYAIGMVVLKIAISAGLLLLILNLVGSVAYKTVTSTTFGLGIDAEDGNKSDANIADSNASSVANKTANGTTGALNGTTGTSNGTTGASSGTSKANNGTTKDGNRIIGDSNETGNRAGP